MCQRLCLFRLWLNISVYLCIFQFHYSVDTCLEKQQDIQLLFRLTRKTTVYSFRYHFQIPSLPMVDCKYTHYKCTSMRHILEQISSNFTLRVCCHPVCVVKRKQAVGVDMLQWLSMSLHISKFEDARTRCDCLFNVARVVLSF